MSDEEAYQLYLAGDESAARVLVEKYGNALTLYLHGYLRDIHEAEDLMIEAFSRVFAKERPIDGEGAFKAYLYKIARNLAARHWQRHRLSLVHMDDLDFELEDDVLADTAFFRDEKHRHLYEAMEQLKAEYREALYLVYFEDMKYRDAAAVMGKTEKQVTKLVYHGKQNLRTILEKQGFVYEND